VGRYFIIAGFLLVHFSFNTFAQEQDSIAIRANLKGVTVYGKRSAFYSEDCKVEKIDSLYFQLKQHSNIGEILAGSMAVHIRSHGGAGNTSSIALRGGNSDHTQVNWNGIPINSTTLGDADLSSLPGLIADEVEVNYSAPSSLYGSGTFGGVINLNSVPDWNNKFRLAVNSEIGSFNSQSYAVNSKFGNKHFQNSIVLFRQTSDVDYPYYNEMQKKYLPRYHNEFELSGGIYNASLKLSKKSTLNTGLWYQESDKNIPPSIYMFTTGGTENQKDKTFKSYLSATRSGNKSQVGITSSLSYDYMLYTKLESPDSDLIFIHSEFNVYKWLNDLNYRYNISNNLTVDFGANYTYYDADIAAYQRKIQEHEGAVVALLKYKMNDIVFNISAREQFRTNLDAKTLFSAGFKSKFFSEKLLVRGNIATKYRVPDFNDKYWPQSGNPNLKPETGWTSDLGFKLKLLNSRSKKVNIGLSPFYNEIKNWIQWMPKGEDGLWIPISYSEVHIGGVDFNINNAFKLNSTGIKLDFLYTFKNAVISKSVDENIVGNFVPYSPQLVGCNKLTIDYKGFVLLYDLRYRSFVYFDQNIQSNQNYIEHYWLSDMSMSKNLKLFSASVNMAFKVANLFNRSYQEVVHYPMPGRAYYISVGFNL